ncbi:UDP-N-acetylmuramoyl-L-alanyl-D-glutamate--2,6-diaminopimelate ligase [Stutzerimonas kirkiae]|uniref:UDP-N-acetylmuramoyl-L-alanyl-D-glutamate--2,6-diaminopimelate ligase n=1 Tax=Stutzerimonas kirkiae TaxID=2211392 RepID=A0A4Q9R9G7_9GAMM|nr:UDP-N-acetylmuramoyl-L-alanyl-D-glutamate--2,6-diaminopimelate ligase [Stutzerimonas kirkiae]TBU97317.1 UDP-N-acetylmuramoyl-L-alanyl-D-glutamate--2,6-diaminopimelate ligase [Stutzerimonas kirkiae]TBV02949.1 UDP-N-acetylmuramoyl-L-alanyl-D-glutamate--2,6-diaminopimelate ligase [Stutzerimonas kirkiae]
MPMPLNQLLPQAGSSVLIRELTLDSRKVRPGDLFLAVPGAQQDGRAHIPDAIARGAAAVAYESEGAQDIWAVGAVLLPVRRLASQLSAIAGRFYGEPSRSLRLAGITGTNGKTSVSQLVAQALDRLGERCGVIGTLGTGFHGELEQGRHTTPDALGVQATLARLKQDGARAVAMEVSSHGLQQGRVAAIDFDVAVFTNLSRDHLDYHGSMQAYGEAKAALFAMPGLKCRVINLDDAFGRELAAYRQDSRLITYSLEDPAAYLYCPQVTLDDDGIRARLVTPQGEGSLHSTLLGRFNVSNALAAIGTLLALNHPLDEILAVFPALQGPAGRMQRLGGNRRPLVVVDYAHTPDALEKVLLAMRPHVQGRLICLFGCGGERDRGKRPLMAAVAERLADQVLVTDDNPRGEAAAAIRAEIMQGFSAPAPAPARVREVAGRAAAIATAVAASRIGDVLLLAGKGHEDYQEIAGERLPFSDLLEARKALDAWEVSHV